MSQNARKRAKYKYLICVAIEVFENIFKSRLILLATKYILDKGQHFEKQKDREYTTDRTCTLIGKLDVPMKKVMLRNTQNDTEKKKYA